jgi:hypothetical protein
MEDQKITTAANYQERLSLWKTSGKNKWRFCEEIGISYHSFAYWIRKEKGKVPKNKFHQLIVRKEPERISSDFFSITFPNKCVLKIHQKVDASFLHQLLNKCK